MGADETRTIVAEWNDTARNYPHEGGLVARLNAQVAFSPTHPAIIFAGASIIYGDLNVHIDWLTRAIVASRAEGHIITTLKCLQEVKVCEIKIQNNVIGFDEKCLGRISAVFQRLHG